MSSAARSAAWARAQKLEEEFGGLLFHRERANKLHAHRAIAV
jgi:hypothetical protein